MNKRLALASAAVGSTVILAGILGIRAVQAEDYTNQTAFHDRLLNRMQEFWGEDFNREAFEQRFEIFTEKRQEKKLAKINEYNQSELSEYLGLDFQELRELQMGGTTLLEYAEENDLDADIIAELIEAEILGHLDEALESGKITQEQYDDKAEHIEDAVSDRMNGEGFRRFRGNPQFSL